MPSLSGGHRQTSSGRSLHYWLSYESINAAEAFFACVISEPSKGMFGNLERGSTVDGTVRIGPDCVPVELAIRSRVLSYIEATDFGEWRPPPPSWIGWRGPV